MSSPPFRARRSGRSFRTALGVENKSPGGDFDPVTAADRAAEAAMRALIKKTFPEHGIVGEELGVERPDAEYVWVLDPIDGTKSFICGMPVWGTLIALTRRGKPMYGMMHQPFTREHFTGDGSRRQLSRTGWRPRAARASVRGARRRGVAHDQPVVDARGRPRTFRRVEQAVRLSRYGGDCYSYCMLAAGHLDLVIETELKPYDVLPLIPIINGSGGVVTTWEDSPPHRAAASSPPATSARMPRRWNC